ncbi:MAG TPA: YtxH domain-containing protein [Pyrinomonadaceae bacterium]|nr:YtxH domain-containing protein [Acidobacteriota bacterium]HQZ95733.1 YtxH domain-containing protein [Pyrinomonadaceae bacterium]
MINTNKYESNTPEQISTRFSARDGITYLLIGGGIGAVLALLFAPKSGREMRTEIADVSKRGYDLTLEKATELKGQSAEAIKAVKEKAAAVYDFAASKLNADIEAAGETVSAASTAIADGIEDLKEDVNARAKNSSIGRKSASIF